MRSIGLQPAVVFLTLGRKSDERQVKRATNAGCKPPVNQMRLIGAGQSGIVTEQPAEGVVGVEIPVIRQTFIEYKFQAVITALRSGRFEISERLKRLQVQSAARVADDVSLAAGRVDDARVFNCFIDILIGVTNAQNVVSAQLPFRANRELSLPERLQIRIDCAAIQECRRSRIVCIDAQVLLTSAASAGSDKTGRRDKRLVR